MKYGIWVMLIIATYAVFAAEFTSLRVIPLPLNSSTVDKLNDIAKNFSLSYIAGVVFYCLSELIPFIRKRLYVRMKACVLVSRLLNAIQLFLEDFCGSSETTDMNLLYYDACQREYNGSDNYKLKANQHLASKRLLVVLDDTLNMLLQQDIYLDEEDHRMLLNIKADPFYGNLLRITQATESAVVSGKTLMETLNGIVNMQSRLKGLKIIEENYGR